MRERHFGEAQQVVRPFQNRWIESERAADDELDMTCAVQPETIDFPRKFLAGQLMAFDGERDDERIVTYMLGDAFAFLSFDLPFNSLTGMLRRFLVGHFDDVKLAVSAESFRIFGDGVAQIFFLDFTDGDKGDLHGLFFSSCAVFRSVRYRSCDSALRYGRTPSCG